jgi:hypothetical protein
MSTEMERPEEPFQVGDIVEMVDHGYDTFHHG